VAALDPYLAMNIAKQHRKELEREAADYRLWREASSQHANVLTRLSRRTALKASDWVSSLSSWLKAHGEGAEPSLDGRMHASHRRG
jgi:hypothetical protein